MGSKARPVSAGSRNAWCDYGSARPDSQFDFGQDGIRDDPDLSPGENDSTYNEPGAKPKSSTAVATKGSKKKSTSFVGKIGRGIRSLWATRQTEDVKGDRELHVKTTLRELIVYIVFLVILCIITFGMTSTTMYYYTKVMSDLFLDTTWSGGGSFRSITSVEDFWKFSKGPLMKGLYWETWYNNQTVPDDQLGYIYYENKLLGVPRLRQLQVHSNSCVVHDDFKKVIRECYESYAESLENKEPFGEKDNANTAWFYRSEDELDGSSHWGLIATYSGAGYVQDLYTNKTESEAMISYLFDKRWIQRGTRIVFIDFTVYNANINLFCVVRLTVEFPPTGGAIPHATMRTVKLIRYVTVMDYFIMACEFIFCLFIIYYMIEEAIEIKKHKFAYFKNFWNILDIVVIVIALVCVAFNIYRLIKVNDLLSDLLNKPDEYADFVFLGYGQTQFDNAIAIAVFFAWIKIFKYISFNKTMTQLSSTLGKCAKDLAGFAVMFFIIFLAFTQLGYLLFGTQVKDFSNFQNSFFTLFRIILGDFDFDQLEAANRVLGPIFFMLFVFFVFFVLINMFLAIINDTYSEVKGDMANQKNEFEMTDYFKRGYEKMIGKLNFKHDKIVDIQKALHSADMNNDKQVDFDEWRQDLKTRGYADGEIEALFAKYDTDGDRVLDENEQKRMQADLNDQKAALNKEYDDLEKLNRPESAHRSTSRVSINDGSGTDTDDEDSRTKSSRSGPSQSVSYEEFTVLSRRVDRMEHSIGSIVSKIDAVLVKLELMEKAKLKRRETMGKILDSITESDGTSDEVKREQMERLVREELERWDSESSITPQPSARGPSPGSGGRGGARPRSRPDSGGNSDTEAEVFVWPQGDVKSDEESDESNNFTLRVESSHVSNHPLSVLRTAHTSVSDTNKPDTNDNQASETADPSKHKLLKDKIHGIPSGTVFNPAMTTAYYAGSNYGHIEVLGNCLESNKGHDSLQDVDYPKMHENAVSEMSSTSPGLKQDNKLTEDLLNEPAVKSNIEESKYSVQAEISMNKTDHFSNTPLFSISDLTSPVVSNTLDIDKHLSSPLRSNSEMPLSPVIVPCYSEECLQSDSLDYTNSSVQSTQMVKPLSSPSVYGCYKMNEISMEVKNVLNPKSLLDSRAKCIASPPSLFPHKSLISPIYSEVQDRYSSIPQSEIDSIIDSPYHDPNKEGRQSSSSSISNSSVCSANPRHLDHKYKPQSDLGAREDFRTLQSDITENNGKCKSKGKDGNEKNIKKSCKNANPVSPATKSIETDQYDKDYTDAKVQITSNVIFNELSHRDKERHNIRKKSRNRDRKGMIAKQRGSEKSSLTTTRGQKVSIGTLAKQSSNSTADENIKHADDTNTDKTTDKGSPNYIHLGKPSEQSSLQQIQGIDTEHQNVTFKYTKQTHYRKDASQVMALKGNLVTLSVIPVDLSLRPDTDVLHPAPDGNKVVSVRNQVLTHSSCKTPVMEKVSATVFV